MFKKVVSSALIRGWTKELKSHNYTISSRFCANCFSRINNNPHFSSSAVQLDFGRKFSSGNNPELSLEEVKVLRELEEEEAKYLEDKKLKGSVSEEFVPFTDQQRIIQDVIDEVWNPLPRIESRVFEPPPHFFHRGKTGVFDLPELIEILKEENCLEIVTIRIPKEIDYADNMVIVTCRSSRHLSAVATYVRKRYKTKQLKKSDVIPANIPRRSHKWIALDFGNIVLHLMLPDVRDQYDLEMLWTVGPNFDDLCNTDDPELIKLLNMIE